MRGRNVAGLFKGRKPRALWGGAGKAARQKYASLKGEKSPRAGRRKGPYVTGLNLPKAYRELREIEQLREHPKTRAEGYRRGTEFVLIHLVGAGGKKRYRWLLNALQTKKGSIPVEAKELVRIVERRAHGDRTAARKLAEQIIQAADELRAEINKKATDLFDEIYELPAGRRAFREPREDPSLPQKVRMQINFTTHELLDRQARIVYGTLKTISKNLSDWVRTT